MKTLSEISRNSLKYERKVVLCHFVGHSKLQTPTLSSELKCHYCNCVEHFVVLEDPNDLLNKNHRWICANVKCLDIQALSAPKNMTAVKKRAVEWNAFCDANSLGDADYKVKFEDINQSIAMKDFFSKFVAKPSGFVILQGDRGLGKTFASLAICEKFTRSDANCIFKTGHQLYAEWLDSIRSCVIDFAGRFKRATLLVIDDFGATEHTPAYMSFFQDLMNYRSRQLCRGTIISTNLMPTKFNDFCGAPLTDRFREGYVLAFRGETRRAHKVIY